MTNLLVGQTLSTSQQDHLKALYHLEEGGRAVPTKELARRLGISAPSVSEMMARLAELGYVRQDRYRGQRLTEEGRRVALELVRHHRLLEMFLVQVLGYGWDEVHEEAERLEHVISERMEERMFEVLGRPRLDPHGHAIPTREGRLLTPADERPLLGCGAGETVTVSAVDDDDPARLRELEKLGLRPGVEISLLAGSVYESPLEIMIAGRRRSVPLGLARAVRVAEGRR